MSSLIVLLVYGGAVLLALFLLYRFGSLRWYWHAAAIAAAVGIGVMPPSEQFRGPVADLVIGFAFVALFTWGLGAPVAQYVNRQRHA